MTNITLPIDAATDSALERIAAATQRDKVKVAADALAAFAQDEAEIIDGILRGMADVAAGRTVSHEEAMERLRKTAFGE
jgi:predicted transcriptional regulator